MNADNISAYVTVIGLALGSLGLFLKNIIDTWRARNDGTSTRHKSERELYTEVRNDLEEVIEEKNFYREAYFLLRTRIIELPGGIDVVKKVLREVNDIRLGAIDDPHNNVTPPAPTPPSTNGGSAS